MLSPITKDIEGFSVRFRPMAATRAFTLAKRVGEVVLPILKGVVPNVKNVGDLSSFLNADIDIQGIVDSISEALANLPDEKAVGIIVDSLKGCTVTAPSQAPVEISNSSDVDAVFQGELDAMYAIVFESWKYNKLAPFKLAARFGLQMKTTDTSSEAAGTGTKHGAGLALSGTSPKK